MPLSDTSAKEKCERTVAWAQETIYELTVGDENCVQLDVEWYNEDTEDMEQLAMSLPTAKTCMPLSALTPHRMWKS